MVRVREANWSIQSAGSCANERIAVRNKVRIVQLLSQPPPVSLGALCVVTPVYSSESGHKCQCSLYRVLPVAPVPASERVLVSPGDGEEHRLLRVPGHAGRDRLLQLRV